MKTCPDCKTQYTDDTLRFCLQDGALLGLNPVGSEPTISLTGGEIQTVARQFSPEADDAASDVTVVRQRAVTESEQRPGGSSVSKIAIAIGALAVALLLFAAVGAYGIWRYFQYPSIAAANNNKDNSNSLPPGNMTYLSTPTPASTSTPQPSPASSPVSNSSTNLGPSGTPPQDVNKAAASRDITRQIQDWKSFGETGDLEAQMQTYAPTVDYYRKRAATRDFVRADRSRAYRMFNSMSITISNVSVSVDDLGETASAVFDKEWVFDGSRRSTGKVRQQLQFRRVAGRWLISGERDIKVYYTN